MKDDKPPANGGAPDPQTGGSGDAGDPRGAGPSREQALLRKLRKQEKELASLREADEQRKNASLSESERLAADVKKLQAERDDLVAKMRQQEIQHRFESAARAAGAVDPKAAYKLADLSAVEIDDNGEISGLDEVLGSLKTGYEFLFQQNPPPPPPGRHSGGNPPSGNPGGQLTAERIQSMSSEEFAKLAQDVDAGRIKL